MTENSIFKKVLPVTAICIIVFVLMVFLSDILAADILLSKKNAGSSLTDWKFSWSKEIPDENPPAEWKYTTKDIGISQRDGGKFLHLQTVLPDLSEPYILKIITLHNPIEIRINGQTVYDNGYEANYLWTGNKNNEIKLDSGNSQSTVDIYLRASFNYKFSAFLLPQASADRTGTYLTQARVLGGTVLIAAGLILLILSIILSVRFKNIGKLPLCGFILILTGALYLLPSLDFFFVNLTNPLFFKLMLVSMMSLAAFFIVLTLGVIENANKWLIGMVLFLLGYPLAFIFIRNQTLLYYMLLAYPVLSGLAHVAILVQIIKKIHHKMPNGSWIYAGYLLFGLTFIYDFASYTYSLNDMFPSLCYLGIFFFLIILINLTLKQLIYVNIRLDEREDQIKRDKIWIERIIKASAQIFAKKNMTDFCIQTAQSIKELIISDAEDEEVLTDEKVAAAKAVLINVGMKNAEGFDEVYNEGDNPSCPYSVIMEKHYYKKDEYVFFGTSYLDMLLFEKNELVCIIHLEGIAHGLSDNLKNIIRISYSNISVALDNLSLKADMTKTQDTVFFQLANLSEAKSKETGAHIKRVSEYVKILCEEMGFTQKQIEIVSRASMMHDIGKLAVPEEIITKQGALTDEEFSLIKQHVLHGYYILSKSPGEFMQAAAIIAQQHHERWDGSGYLGLKGEAIHLYARIVALADVFDALLDERSYKAAWGFEQTCTYINRQSGTQFDPTVVNAFNRGFYRLYKAHERISDEA